MAIGIGSDLMLSQYQQTGKNAKAEKLQNKLNGVNTADSTDEEMMEVCKEFEAYLVEKVMKQMKEAMTSNEDEKGEYLSYFGDMMYQQYASQIAENGELGLAKQLYESMKTNTISPVQNRLQSMTAVETPAEVASEASAAAGKKTEEQ